MGTKYRRLFMESVVSNRPTFWIAPPANVMAADISETVVSAIFAGVGGFVISGGVSYLSAGSASPAQSLAWAGVSFGTVLVAPIMGEVIADVAGDVTEAIARGWNRGQPVEIESEQATSEPTEDDLGAARLPGHWWYTTRNGQSHCYQTPTDKNRQVIISDQRMKAIFNLVLTGTPFSFVAIRKQVSVSQPRFEILQRDWRTRYLYRLNDDKTGYLTDQGKQIAQAIVSTPLPSRGGSA